MATDDPLRAGSQRRLWAFIIDLAVVSLIAAAVWAPLAERVGDPLRFEPFYLTPEMTCTEVESFDRTDDEGRRVRMTDELCELVYLGRWRSYQRFRTEAVGGNGPGYSNSVAYAADAAGNPITVFTDGLAAMLLLLVMFTVLEASALRASLGKLILGLEVVGEDGGRLGGGAAFARNLMKLLPFMVLYTPGYWGPPLAGLLDSDLTGALVVGSMTAGVLILAETALAVVAPRYQTLYDRVAHAVVRRRP